MGSSRASAMLCVFTITISSKMVHPLKHLIFLREKMVNFERYWRRGIKIVRTLAFVFNLSLYYPGSLHLCITVYDHLLFIFFYTKRPSVCIIWFYWVRFWLHDGFSSVVCAREGNISKMCLYWSRNLWCLKYFWSVHLGTASEC